MLKRITISTLLLTGIIASGYAVFNKSATNCMLAEVMYMHEVIDNVYISPDASEEQIRACIELVSEAKHRNKALWGRINSDPVFLFCTNWDDYHKFGMYRTQAMTRMNFAGEYIILSPAGIHPDDVSHEMCHAELYSRVGYENDKKIPLWFHEGLAMLVCRDYPQNHSDYLAEWDRMTKESPDILPLNRISSDDDFYSSPSRSNLAYWRSGMEVSRWFEKGGREGLMEMMTMLNEGSDFNSSYGTVERQEH